MTETAEMSATPGLPTPGSHVTVHITRVHVHPLCELVEFWGQFSEDRKEAHQHLARDIQSPEKPFHMFEGTPGDQCLVLISDTWYRSHIVSRNGSECNVFLIDKGLSHATTTSMLAWGKKAHFYLPPEVEFCVLANVLPLSPENRWSPVALEFMKRLSGKSAVAYVQDVLVTQRTILLHIPCILKQMCEMGLARLVSRDGFHAFVQKSLQLGNADAVPPWSMQNSTKNHTVGVDEKMRKQQLFLHPELSTETLETVIITEVTDPQRIFCQLKVFSPELKKLSEQMTQWYEDRLTSSIGGHIMIGLPCAARGSDGWYRSVIQQVFAPKKLVEVLNVDYGTKHIVQVEHVKPLAAEFFRMPIVTYNCSLHGLIDKGVGWNRTQIDYLKALLLHKTMIAKFEYQSRSEGVHYVTLYGDQNININNLFGSNVDCLLEYGKPLDDFTVPSSTYSRQHTAQQERRTPTCGQAEDCKEKRELPQAEVLTVNTSCLAVVQHVLNPSEFWIQTETNTSVLDKLMDGMFQLYRDSVSEYRVWNPAVGLYCAAKAKDGDFYRATVCEVGETQVEVFFVDYGNAEVVSRSDIRTLPDEFRTQPWLAVKCKLANVGPKGGDWSHSATQCFTEAVIDKVLNVHVRGKRGDCYVVQLADAEPRGERDVGELMCSSGFAECDDTQRPVEAKMRMQPALIPAAQNPDATLGLCRKSKVSFQTQNTAEVNNFEGKMSMFEEPMFPIGSVLDVNVSFIESPNDFWCQLVQNAWHLKLLTHDIQAHYADSEFEPFEERACIARFPANGMWYRGLIIKKHEMPHVDVRFVDYGHTESVSIHDLRRICPQFMTLKGQAFRCSLLNPLDKSSAKNDWSPEATAKFNDFVDSASSGHGILKCTIYAVLYTEQVIFNLVDLETPFESVGSIMAKLIKSAPPRKTPGQSFHFDTYYYSTHGVKTGTDEQVTVTFVNSVGQFYCQLARNANVMEDLKKKVNSLCHRLKNVSLPEVETLCFAKHSDGQWYRGQIKARKPAILVHFVDYGDTVELDKTDLLPIPKEANDIMSVPAQAVACCLSDVPADVPCEVNSWFERHVTECKFRALVVAREPDGQLLVELYQGNDQINSKINKMFQIEMRTEEQVLYQGRRASEACANHAPKFPKAVPKQSTERDRAQIRKPNTNFAPKPTCQVKNETNAVVYETMSHNCKNGQQVKPALALYKPPQRGSVTANKMGGGPKSADAHAKQKEGSRCTDSDQPMTSKVPDPDSQTNTFVTPEASAERLPKVADLPAKCITSGMEADVFISHCDSPLSFCVQFVREEAEIVSLVEKLNDSQSTQNPIGTDVQPGDLVQAEFPDDFSWYRAAVREIQGNSMALVEFIDYGNTTVIPISKICKLHESFTHVQMYSTHCKLSDAAALESKVVLAPEVVSAFKRDTGVGAEKQLKCRFVRQSGSQWEVHLEDSGVSITCKVPSMSPTSSQEELFQISDGKHVPEKVEPAALRYHEQDFPEGQQLEVYVTAVHDGQSFWCQSADISELEKIILSVSEVGNAADDRKMDINAFSPGSPCVARYAEDQLWYRAEVLDKDKDNLSVLFVDYGNQSEVPLQDVRKMSPDLVETPPQAFLCELEGFGPSGFWHSAAVDELSALTDKLFHLTVCSVTRKGGRMKCFVQLECEGEVINESLRHWWTTSAAENHLDTVELSSSCELTETKAVLGECPPSDSPTFPAAEDDEDQSEQRDTEALVDGHTADVMHGGVNRPNSDVSGDLGLCESFTEIPEEGIDLTLSECNLDIKPGIFSETYGARETFSGAFMTTVPTSDVQPCDGDVHIVLPQPDDEQDRGVLSCGENVETESEGASAMDTEPDGFKSSPARDDGEEAVTPTAIESPKTCTIIAGATESAPAAADELLAKEDGREDKYDVAPDELESMLEDVDAHNTGGNDDVTVDSEANEEQEERTAIATDISVSSQTSVVSCQAAGHRENVDLDQTIHVNEEDWKVESIQTSCVTPVQELLAEADRAASEQHGDAVPSADTRTVFEEDTWPAEEACFADVSTERTPEDDTAVGEQISTQNEVADGGGDDGGAACPVAAEACLNVQSDDVTKATDECLRVTAEEMVPNDSLLPFNVIHHEVIESRSERTMKIEETMSCADSHNENDSMTEEETSALCDDEASDLWQSSFDSVSAELISDKLQTAETLVSKEFNDGVRVEQVPPADDSLAAHLSNATHLCLLIMDSCAEALQRQPEE